HAYAQWTAFRPGESMGVGFVALERRINRDTEALHDFLWHGEKKDEKSLIRSLRNDARAADVFLQLGGRLRTNADELAEELQSSGKGESLFELLSHLWGLGAATVIYSNRNYRGGEYRYKSLTSTVRLIDCVISGCI